MAKQVKAALGKGLGALITMEEPETVGSSSINEVELSQIVANPNQPRKDFDEDALNELADSIKIHGLVQPITVRETDDNHDQIISGERRYRASVKAGLTTIPAYVKKASDDNMAEMALIENIQREDLNAIEIALAFQTLLDKHQLTQEKLSERIGKKRATIANFLRLLKLPAEIQIGLKDKKIDMGHAKLLLSLDDTSTQLMVYEQVIEYGFSVRKTDEIIRALNGESQEITPEEPAKSTKKTPAPQTPSEYKMLTAHLSNFFGSKVAFNINDKGAGKITIPFASAEDLERIMQLLDSKKI
ncbi:MAG: ParB/RepB/Spo0J family partition protein [Dysgonamonadaceae bacterium]|jgi:ParB family chromosome partitioning protein|nr:ParB/RepB/Spo0J family partition protein [Dysgonamonadaceae bacterium]